MLHTVQGVAMDDEGTEIAWELQTIADKFHVTIGGLSVIIDCEEAHEMIDAMHALISSREL